MKNRSIPLKIKYIAIIDPANFTLDRSLHNIKKIIVAKANSYKGVG